MNAIKNLRIKCGLTQRDIAEKLKISTSTVTKWETGDSCPRAEMLPELARILGCTIDELFNKAQEAG